MTDVALRPPRSGGGPRPQSARLLAAQVRYSLHDLWRTRIVFVFTFLFPLTWLLVMGLLTGNAVVDGSQGVHVMQFVTPTAAAMGVLYAAYPTVATALATAREQGVLKRVRGTPLPPWIYLTGRIAAVVVFAVGSVLTMLAVGVLAYDVQILGRTVVATAVTILVGIGCFAALGLAVAALARSASLAQAASIASAVVLAFLSGLMTVGTLPPWTDRIASAFPLKPFNDALKNQFDPYGTGAGWDLGALAVMVLWGLAAAVVAARAFRFDPGTGAAGRALPGTVGAAGQDGTAPSLPRPAVWVPAPRTSADVPARSPGRPSVATLVRDQVWWANRAARRDPGWMFFAVAMPVALYAFIMTIDYPDRVGPDQVPVALYSAAGMIAWGTAFTAFINLPQAVASARDRGVLKRLRGSPLTPAVYLLARTVSALWIAVLTGALVVAIGLVFFDLSITWAGIPAAVGVLLLGTLALAACGFALAAVVPNAKAMGAAGLGILLPLAFFSDVFVVEGAPSWMSTVGSIGPMKHLADSLTAALAPAGPTVDWTSIAVLTIWLLAAGVVAARTFRWDATSR